MVNPFRKIGSAFKWLGEKMLWVLRRNETLLAVSLAADALPIPALDKIVLLVRSLDRKNIPGEQKMAEALEKILPILAEYGVDVKDESQLRLLIEIAVAIMKKRARVVAPPKEN